MVEKEKTDYIFTENKVKYSSNLPLDDIMKLADSIWKEVRQCRKNENDVENNQLYYFFYNKYKDFGTSFPLVLRWMVQADIYNKKAFEKFLVKYSNTVIESKQDFLKLQAEYLVYISKEDRHYSVKDISAYREHIIKELLKEDEDFTKIENEFKEELIKEQSTSNDERRQILYNHFKNKLLT